MKFVITTACYKQTEPIADDAHISHLSRGLVSRGHDVHILYSWDANRYKGYDAKVDPSRTRQDPDGVFLHPVRSPLGPVDPYLGYATGVSPFFEKAFHKLVRDLKPDVVHHHNIFFLGHRALRKRADYLCLYTPHDFWLVCTRNDLLRNGRFPCDRKACFICGLSSISSRPPQFWRMTPGFQRSLRDIDIILTPSAYMKERLGTELPNRIEHLPVFAVPPPRLDGAVPADYFLCAGQLSPHKGILPLLEAFRLHSKEIPARLVLVGKGPLEEEIRRFIKRYNLEDKIRFLGWVSHENLWQLYQSALAVLVPSIWPENCPAVALEALSVGTPVIGSDQGGLPEIIGKVDSNLVFPAGDIDGMAAALASFDRALYPAPALQKIYREEYSLDTYLERYLELIVDGAK